MRFVKVLVVPALLLFLASTASADDLNIIFDPSFVVQDVNSTTIGGAGPITVSWQTCAPGVPAGQPQIYNAAGCLYFYNAGPAITHLILTFVVPPEPSYNPTVWTGITCIVLDSTLPSTNCPSSIVTGQTVTLDFIGTTGIPTGAFFYIAENDSNGGVKPADMPAFTVLVPTYDPSTLTLLATGIGLLALGGMRRYA